MIDLTLPDFLRIDADERRRAWHGKRLRWTRDMRFADKPSRVEEAATKKLRREIEKAKAEKKKAALKKLRENY